MWYNCYAQTHVEFVINGTTSSILMSAFVSHWFVLSLSKYYTICESMERQNWCEADVVNLLLWGAHNVSACILSHNKFIALWLEYKINGADSFVVSP